MLFLLSAMATKPKLSASGQPMQAASMHPGAGFLNNKDISDRVLKNYGAMPELPPEAVFKSPTPPGH